MGLLLAREPSPELVCYRQTARSRLAEGNCLKNHVHYANERVQRVQVNDVERGKRDMHKTAIFCNAQTTCNE